MSGRALPTVLVATALALTACGGAAEPAASPAPATSSTSASGPAAAGQTLTIKSFAFSPSLTVPPSEKVRVVNQDAAPHTVTAEQRAFDVRLGGNATAELTAPTRPGGYPFQCTIHPQMKGTLTVTG